MTKQQKARAHLARAQELIQDTLGFGVKRAHTAVLPQSTQEPSIVSTHIRWEHDNRNETGPAKPTLHAAFSDSKGKATHTRWRYKEDMTRLLNLPDELITKMITDGGLDGAQLIMLMQVGNDNLNRIIKDTLAMMSKRYDDDAILIEDLNMIYLLLKHGDKRAHPTLFAFAILRRIRDLVTALLEAGEDVNQMLDVSTATPLSWAVYLCRYDIAKILIEYRADVNKKVRDYENPSVYITPLDLAFKKYLSRRSEITGDEFKIVKYLLENGADPDMMVYLSKDTDDTEPTQSYKFRQRDLDPSNQKDEQLLSLLRREENGTL